MPLLTLDGSGGIWATEGILREKSKLSKYFHSKSIHATDSCVMKNHLPAAVCQLKNSKKNFFWSCLVACRILVSQSGIESTFSAVEGQSLNHWTARLVLVVNFFFFWLVFLFHILSCYWQLLHMAAEEYFAILNKSYYSWICIYEGLDIKCMKYDSHFIKKVWGK